MFADPKSVRIKRKSFFTFHQGQRSLLRGNEILHYAKDGNDNGDAEREDRNLPRGEESLHGNHFISK